jgi:hypothetical protein
MQLESATSDHMFLPLHDENPGQEGDIAPCRSPDLGPHIQTQGTVQAAVPFPASGHGRYQAACKETINKIKKKGLL